MNARQFVDHWKTVELSERSACHSHFIALCGLLELPPPVDADPKGEWFAFEKGLTTTEGKQGFADVWRKGHFGWEYKKKHADLGAAFRQLLRYREALQNPPLLVVCDMERFEIHTNWPNTVKKVYAFTLDQLTEPRTFALLRSTFISPEELNPGKTREQVTEEIAGRFAALANGLQKRVAPHAAARFLLKLMFCMFAEDIGLLRDRLFTGVLAAAHNKPDALSRRLKNLFEVMATGGTFGADDILWFNGGLFADAEVVDLTPEEIKELIRCALFDWSQVEPSIFGTLFERTLDPDKRAQIGAHYTGRREIEELLQPVLLDPLRREWDAVRDRADALWATLQSENRKTGGGKGAATKKARAAFDACVRGFLRRLTEVTVLDPACGSGNFLYLALHMLLDLEKEVCTYASAHDVTYIPQVAPAQLRGLEINTYARELAQVVIWIGFLQWHKFNGFRGPDSPVLDAMEGIRRTDAILDLSDPAAPKEVEWPDAEFIVGNPPFLGGNKIRNELGDEYVEALFRAYDGRVPGFADICCGD